MLARDFTDKRASLLGAGSVGQRDSWSSCTHHFVPKPSAPKQVEFGDPMTLQMERGAWGKLGWDKKGKIVARQKPPLKDQNV